VTVIQNLVTWVTKWNKYGFRRWQNGTKICYIIDRMILKCVT